MLNNVWDTHRLRDYQVLTAIFYIAFLKMQLMYLIRKTDVGKSLFLIGAASIRCDVTASLVPLLGLGSSHDHVVIALGTVVRVCL